MTELILYSEDLKKTALSHFNLPIKAAKVPVIYSAGTRETSEDVTLSPEEIRKLISGSIFTYFHDRTKSDVIYNAFIKRVPGLKRYWNDNIVNMYLKAIESTPLSTQLLHNLTERLYEVAVNDHFLVTSVKVETPLVKGMNTYLARAATMPNLPEYNYSRQSIFLSAVTPEEYLKVAKDISFNIPTVIYFVTPKNIDIKNSTLLSRLEMMTGATVQATVEQIGGMA